MEIVRILVVLVIFIAVINIGSYLRQMNETLNKIHNLLKEDKK